MESIELCAEEMKTQLKVDGSVCQIDVVRASEGFGPVGKMATFFGQLGRLLQVGFGKPFSASDGENFLEVYQRGPLIHVIFTARNGLRTACKILRKDFYDAIMRGLRAGADRHNKRK